MNWLSWPGVVRLIKALLILVILRISACAIAATETASAPPADELARAGQRTLKKFRRTPASWRARMQLPNGFTLETKVTQDRNRQAWSFAIVENGRAKIFSRLIETNGVWHVIDANRHARYRPYEAELTLPGGYLMLALAEIRCVQDEQLLTTARFEGRKGQKILYRVPLAPEGRRLIEKSVAGLEKIQKENPTYPIKPETLNLIETMREQLAKGAPLAVDSATGILVECKLRDMLISIEDFSWLDKADNADFPLPQGVVWDDQARSWTDSELKDCLMVGHDPIFQSGGESPSIDAYLLNIRSGRLHRIPYQGIVSMGGCFLKDRHEVIVSGFGVDGAEGLIKINLETGANSPVEPDLAQAQISMNAELSPDSKTAATIQISGNGQMTDFQIRIVNLVDGGSRVLGKPARIGAPYSWLPDGEGLILKRFKPVDDLRAIEPTVLCRMALDGKLTDLRPGDWPVVLRKSRRILYEETQSKLWHTCELDGTQPQLFAGGLERHGTPAVSPDETKVVFTRYEKGRLPELLLFEMGKSEGKAIVKAPGFTGTPIWR